jgi:hypothetical protein
MPNRFDIFITRLETKNARDGTSSNPIGDPPSARHDKADTKPSRSGEAISEKDRAKRRHKHDA